uniref:Capsid protein n=1 Tax=Turnip rosette virus TaxID=218923 RepID=S4Z705_9VIRU|nr:coat protein [Turnip rosette virus]
MKKGDKDQTRNQQRKARKKKTQSGKTNAVVTPIWAPVSTGTVMQGGALSISPLNNKGDIRVCGREVVTEISVSNTPTPSVLQVIPETFPTRLKGLATSWSKFKWRAIKFVYMPICPTTETGSVHFGFLYDTVDNLPGTVGEISTLQGYSTGPAWAGTSGNELLELGVYAETPKDAVVARMDARRADKKYYPIVSTTQLTKSLTVDASLGNTYVPARLAIVTADGTAAADKPKTVGRLYAVFCIDLIDTIASSLNV